MARYFKVNNDEELMEGAIIEGENTDEGQNTRKELVRKNHTVKMIESSVILSLIYTVLVVIDNALDPLYVVVQTIMGYKLSIKKIFERIIQRISDHRAQASYRPPMLRKIDKKYVTKVQEQISKAKRVALDTIDRTIENAKKKRDASRKSHKAPSTKIDERDKAEESRKSRIIKTKMHIIDYMFVVQDEVAVLTINYDKSVQRWILCITEVVRGDYLAEETVITVPEEMAVMRIKEAGLVTGNIVTLKALGRKLIMTTVGHSEQISEMMYSKTNSELCASMAMGWNEIKMIGGEELIMIALAEEGYKAYKIKPVVVIKASKAKEIYTISGLIIEVTGTEAVCGAMVLDGEKSVMKVIQGLKQKQMPFIGFITQITEHDERKFAYVESLSQYSRAAILASC